MKPCLSAVVILLTAGYLTIKLSVGMDILELLHTTTVMPANITDRIRTIDMVDYCCDISNYLST